jgi:hypothetical protein
MTTRSEIAQFEEVHTVLMQCGQQEVPMKNGQAFLDAEARPPRIYHREYFDGGAASLVTTTLTLQGGHIAVSQRWIPRQGEPQNIELRLGVADERRKGIIAIGAQALK